MVICCHHFSRRHFLFLLIFEVRSLYLDLPFSCNYVLRNLSAFAPGGFIGLLSKTTRVRLGARGPGQDFQDGSNFCPFVLCIIPTVIITHKERVMLLKILLKTLITKQYTILITTNAMHVFRTVFPHVYVRMKEQQTIKQKKKKQQKEVCENQQKGRRTINRERSKSENCNANIATQIRESKTEKE